MTRVKLSYFDFPGGRGEDCRLALHIAGVDFEDDRVNSRDWAEWKPSTPFGAMPVLEIEGEGTLAQSNAILGLIGSRHGLLPDGDFQAAQHRALLNAAEDLRSRVGHTMGLKDEGQKKSARQELAEGYMKSWAHNVERQIAGPFVAGDRISVADLKLFVLMNWFKKGIVDHISAAYFDGFPRLNGLFSAVAEHPRVDEWYAERRHANAP